MAANRTAMGIQYGTTVVSSWGQRQAERLAQQRRAGPLSESRPKGYLTNN